MPSTLTPRSVRSEHAEQVQKLDGLGVRLVLPEPPSANRWWRRAGTHMHLSSEARKYKERVESLCRLHRVKSIPKGTAVEVYLCWYRSRKAGDLDKRIGVLLDALQGSAYDNDSQITHLTAERRDDKHNPRVEVVITRYTEKAA